MASGDHETIDQVELALAEAKRQRRSAEVLIRMLARLRDELLDVADEDVP